MLKLGLVIALAAAIGQGGQKERAWQEGMLLNPENNAYFKSVERTVDGGGSAFHAAGSSDPEAVKPSLSVKDNYVVDTSDAAYLVERVRLNSSPAAKVYITMQVKFSVDKKKLFLLDRDGKEVETKIVKQALKTVSAGQ